MSVRSIAGLTEVALTELVEADAAVVVLVPVGSVEPHGPHLSLVTDTVISEGAAERGAELLSERGLEVCIAPSLPYGVTECARKFRGAVSIPPQVLTTFLEALVTGYLQSGVDHVCLVNNHLEPAHDAAVRAAVVGVEGASVACPLTRRWARTLSDEFKSGACHAGQYETSLVLARAPELVNEDARPGLPAVDVSLSEQLAKGITDFVDMGMERAYAGAPARASAEEGRAQFAKLGVMVAVTVLEAMGRDSAGLTGE